MSADAITMTELQDLIDKGMKAAVDTAFQGKLEGVMTEFSAIREQLENRGAPEDEIRNLVNGLQEKFDTLNAEHTNLRREVAERNAVPVYDQARAIRWPLTEDDLISLPTTDEERAGHLLNDQLYILGTMLKGENNWTLSEQAEVLRQTKFMRNASLRFGKAIDTVTTGTGLEWVPQGFSSTMFEAVFIANRVANLFPRIPLPTPSYVSPVQLARPKAYKATQGQNRTEDTTSLTDNVTFSAKSLAVYLQVTQEATEDMIVPILSWLQGEMANGMADGVEACILNGDVTATHMDYDIDQVGADAVETCWDGLRHYALANAARKVDISTFNADTLLGLKKALGKYGLNPSDLVWTFGPDKINDLLLLRDSKDNLLMTTLDKYGAQATIVTGEVGRLFGIPVVPSASQRENVSATGVNTQAGPNTRKTCQLTYRPAWFIGDRKRVTLETDKNIVNQTHQLVASARYDFKHVYADTEHTTAVGYNGG